MIKKMGRSGEETGSIKTALIGIIIYVASYLLFSNIPFLNMIGSPLVAGLYLGLSQGYSKKTLVWFSIGVFAFFIIGMLGFGLMPAMNNFTGMTIAAGILYSIVRQSVLIGLTVLVALLCRKFLKSRRSTDAKGRN